MRWPFWVAVVVVVSAVSTLVSTFVEAMSNPPAVPATAQAQPVPADGAARPLTAADVDTWLDGFLPTALATSDIAGATVVVVKDGQVLTQRGFGYADVATRAPVDPARTLFRPGSVSKLFTWTAVMQLVEQGRVDLDADVNTYLDFQIPARDGGPVTLRTMMTHTAGFEEALKDLLGDEAHPTPTYDQILKRWVPERIYPAGSTPAYSNYATALAGYVVERVSGEPFADYIQRHIFDPLGMRDSTFVQPLPADLAGRMATGYQLASGDPAAFELVGLAPAGALSSTGADMARFMIAHLEGGGGILRPETVALMHNTAVDPVPPLNNMRLGFFETNVNGREVLAHLGDTNAFHSALHLFTAENTGLYLVFNSTGVNGAANTLRSELFEKFADRYFPGTAESNRAPTDRVDPTTAAEHAALMAGRWSSSRRPDSTFLSVVDLLGQVNVSAGPNGELNAPVLPGPAGQSRRWVEVEPFVWHDLDSSQRLAAVVENGEVVRFSIDEASPFLVYERTPWYRSGALLLPLLYASLAVLVLTVLMWPAGALLRRRYQVELGPPPFYRISRLSALLTLVVLVGWALTINTMLGGTLLNSDYDALVVTLQVLGIVAFGGGLVVLLAHGWVVWRARTRWSARLWSVALVLADVVVLWVALAFHLLDIGVLY